MTPLIIMVGADKGGVGKTTVSRVLNDYVSSKLTIAKLYDSEYPNGDLKRFAPAAEIVDTRSVSDQMRIFDTVKGVNIVDVKAGMMSNVLDALNEVRLLDDVKAGAINLALLQVVGPTMGSLSEVASATKALGGSARHFLVRNHVNETGYFEWDADSAFQKLFAERAATTIGIAHLTPRAAETVQEQNAGFLAFTQDASQSRMLRGYVRAWLDAAWAELDRAGIGDLIKAAG